MRGYIRYGTDKLFEKRAFRKLQKLEGKGTPPAPDYAGAATATAQGNLEAARAASAANRINQYTPQGNLVYSHNPTSTLDTKAYQAAQDTYQKALATYNAAPATSHNFGSASGFNLTGGGNVPKGAAPIAPKESDFMTVNPDEGWSSTQTLSPAEQQKLDQTNALANHLLGTASTGIGYVDKALSDGGALDETKLAQSGIQGQAVQDAVMSRLQPQIDRNVNTLRTRLANQGVNEGSEAYQNAMTDQSQQNNDLYTQAALQGIQTGQQARQQGIQEQYAAQDRPLNIVNALRTGAQVNTPQFTAVPQQQTTAGADLLGAAQLTGQYNSGAAASKNAAMGGISSALAGALPYASIFGL